MKNVDLLFITTPTTYTASRDCVVQVHAFGGSGSGGCARAMSNGAGVTGGGAGARCTKKVTLKAGQSLVLTPGAGGAGVQSGTASSGPGDRIDGNDGGDTTVTGPGGLNMVAGGGKKGVAVFNGLLPALGGLGGTASGGDENAPGGRGGNIVASNAGGHVRSTGGGALPFFDQACRGGDVLTVGTYLATGGGGIGGHGGDIIAPANSSCGSGGGGSGGDAPDVSVNASGTYLGGDAFKSVGSLSLPLGYWLLAGGAAGAIGYGGSPGIDISRPDGGAGAGSGGVAVSAVVTGNVGKPGLFAGGGGGAVNGHCPTASGGAGLFFGGSGGACTVPNGTCHSAKGGDGFIILEILP